MSRHLSPGPLEGPAKLSAPGPVAVPDAVKAAVSAPLIHHRTEEFSKLLLEVHDGLRRLFQTSSDVAVLTGTGSVGMESALVSFVDPSRPVLHVGGGKFGLRWAEISEAYGVSSTTMDLPWGEPVDPARVRAFLDEHPDTGAVTLTVCETSTGVWHPIEEISEVLSEYPDCLFLVDGITAVGVQPLAMDKLGIDVLVAGSQKAFAVPPGLAMIAASPKAMRAACKAVLPSYSLDAVREIEKQRQGQTVFSASVSLIRGLHTALVLMEKEPLEALYERFDALSCAARAGLEAMDLQLFSTSPCAAVSTAHVPLHVDAGDLIQRVRALGSVIAGGQNHLKGKIFRIGHLGSQGRDDLLAVIANLELALVECGHSVEPGAGVAAVLRSLRGRG